MGKKEIKNDLAREAEEFKFEVASMSNYKIKNNSKFIDKLDGIKLLIIEFAKVEEAKAIIMINEYWSEIDNLEDEIRLLAETDYYWAMCIIHHPTIGDNIPEWYLDEKFWPPPKWVIERYYK